MTQKTILIVDDERAIRETLKLALELEGYCVNCAANGQEALDQLNAPSRPCLILLDLMMPVMNGWQFVDALRELGKELAQIPVIVLTAFQDRGGTIQVNKVMSKPVDLDLLFETIKHYCEH